MNELFVGLWLVLQPPEIEPLARAVLESDGLPAIEADPRVRAWVQAEFGRRGLYFTTWWGWNWAGNADGEFRWARLRWREDRELPQLPADIDDASIRVAIDYWTRVREASLAWSDDPWRGDRYGDLYEYAAREVAQWTDLADIWSQPLLLERRRRWKNFSEIPLATIGNR